MDNAYPRGQRDQPMYNGGLSQPKPSSSSAPVVIRPSMKLVRPFYTISFVLLALIIGYNNTTERDPLNILVIVPVALAAWTLWRHMKLRFTTMAIQGNKLRFDSGMISKVTRTMELSRIQDVRVDQTLIQRMLGIGNVTVETAGETGRLTMHNVDQPQAVADFILESSRK